MAPVGSDVCLLTIPTISQLSHESSDEILYNWIHEYVDILPCRLLYYVADGNGRNRADGVCEVSEERMIQDKDDMERGWKEFCFWRLTVQTFPLDESGLSIWLIRGAPYVDTLFMIGVDIIRLGVRFEVRK